MVLILAGLATGAYVVHRNDGSHARDLKQRADDAEHAEAELQSKLTAARSSAKRTAAAAYARGVRAGTKAANNAQSATGDTYTTGYDDGLSVGYATLGGFGQWNDGGWYLVRMGTTGESATPYQIETRSPIRPCLWTYVSNDQIYLGTLAC